jgi:hypothetical protein
MALREIRDERGIEWQVWDTRPTLRLGDEAAGAHLHEDAVAGWLTFQSATERRRFYQVPAGWEELSDGDLARLCEHAVAVQTSRP